MIRCIDVRKTYRQGESEITALAGISLDIPEGSFAVIMGPSGSGKSTLLHLIGGLDRPSGGDLLVDGRLIGQMADDQVTLFRRKKIGFVFQFFNLLPTLTRIGERRAPFVLDGRSKREADHQAEILLTKIGLEKRQHHLPEELSGGEIQRVADGARAGVRSADSSRRRADGQSRFQKWRSDLGAAQADQPRRRLHCGHGDAQSRSRALRRPDDFSARWASGDSRFLMLRLLTHGLMAPCEAPPAAHGADFLWHRPRRCRHCRDRGGESLADHLVSIDHRSDRRQSGVAGRQR